MADNQNKTDMINLAILKINGVFDTGVQFLSALDDSVFADYTTGASETEKLACLQYPFALRKALRDIRPKFAIKYEDLGTDIAISTDPANADLFERADWEYIFEFPSDYLQLIKQTNESDKSQILECKEIMVHSWSHLVTGDNDQTYYCDTNHTSVDDSSDGEPPTDDGDGNWSLFSTSDYGVDWEAGRAYKYQATSKLLLSNEYSNDGGDSAYIEYIAYSATGIGDQPAYYDPDFVEAFTTLLAAKMAPQQSDPEQRMKLMQEYYAIAKPMAIARDREPDYEEEATSWLEARN